MKISLITAMSNNFVIGKSNCIPWNLKNDRAWFRKITLNKSIIMGRLTWESINQKALPFRKNIIISRKLKNLKNAIIARSICHAIYLANSSKEIMVIGGSSIYKQFIKFSQKMYITHVHINIQGDTFFPKYNLNNWKSKWTCHNFSDKYNEYNYSFEILYRKNIL